MSIQQYLDKIKNAVYGREVRGAIHDAIKQTYDDASEGGDANMEVKMARGTFTNLNARLDNQDSKISDTKTQLVQSTQEINNVLNLKANQTDLNQTNTELSGVNQRIDNLVIPISPENANVEVTDSHVSIPKGKTFDSLPSRLDEIEQDTIFLNEALDGGLNKLILTWELGGIDAGGNDVPSTTRLRNIGYIPSDSQIKVRIPEGYRLSVSFYSTSQGRVGGSGWITGNYEVPTYYAYYRFMIAKEDDINVNIEDSYGFEFIKESGLLNKTSALEENIDFIGEKAPQLQRGKPREVMPLNDLEQGAISSDDGSLLESSSRLRTTSFRPMYDITELEIETTSRGRLIVFTYDGAYKLISSTGWISGKIKKEFAARFYKIVIADVGDGVEVTSADAPNLIKSIKEHQRVKDHRGYIDLMGETIELDRLPFTGKYKNGAFKVGNIRFPTSDYFKTKTSRLTRNYKYSAWAQDKCFVHNNVVYALYNEGPGHGSDGTRVMLQKSYTDGDSWTEPEIFYDIPSGYKQVACFGAGADENGIYTIIRRRNGRYIVGESDYIFYYKLDSEDEWKSKPLTFSDGDLLPTNYHGFEKLPDGSLAFGYFFNRENGLDDGNARRVGIIKSFDLFDTWETHDIPVGTGNIEPAMCSVGGTVYGTLRGGYDVSGTADDIRNKFWISTDNCQTFQVYSFPSDVSLNNSNITINYLNGKIHILSIGRYMDDDKKREGVMIYGVANESDLESLNVDAFDYYAIGNVKPRNNGGSGVPSGLVVGDSILWIYSSDEEAYNDMPNMFATKLYVGNENGLMNVFGNV